MPTDVPIRCSCGELRGVARGISSRRGNRVVCYCDDCQSFAHFLERPREILDAHGGTDIFQMSPARLEIREGAGRLACMRLRPGGLVRWHTECCRTPIGNTAGTPRLPFVGLIHSCMDHEAAGSRDGAFGPVRARVNARFATGDRAQLDAHDRAPPAMILRFAGILLSARLQGAQKRSPFFDAHTGEIRVAPRILSEAELRSVEAARDSAGAASSW